MVKNGFVQISILVSLLVMVMAIPLATKLVQQSTDSRSKATTGTIHQQNTAAAENKSATGRAELTQTIAKANATNAARNATAGAVTAGAKATDGAEATKTESRYATRAALELKTANANLTSAAVNRNATEVAVKAEITQQIANAYATNAARNATAGAKATVGVDKATSAPTSKSCPPGTHLWLGDCKATLNVTTAPTSAPTKPPISPNRPTTQVNPTVAPEPTMPLFSGACKSGFCIPLSDGIFEDLGSREAYEKYVRDSESANKPAMMVMGGIVGAGAAVVAAPVVANAALAASVYGSPVVANIVSKLPNWFLNLAEKANTVADVYDYVSVIPACAINGIGSGECDNAVQNAMVASQTNNLVPQTVSNKVDNDANSIKDIFQKSKNTGLVTQTNKLVSQILGVDEMNLNDSKIRNFLKESSFYNARTKISENIITDENAIELAYNLSLVLEDNGADYTLKHLPKVDLGDQPSSWYHTVSIDDYKLDKKMDSVDQLVKARQLEINPWSLSSSVYATNDTDSFHDPIINAWNNNINNALVLEGKSQGKGVLLGNFFNTNPGCEGNVCYMNSELLHAVLAENGYKSSIFSYNFDMVDGDRSGHSVVLMQDKKNGQMVILDPTWNNSWFASEYKEVLTKQYGFSNFRSVRNEVIFKVKEKE